MSEPMRVTVVMTHPIQYYSPWFRFIENEAPELRLTVLYASEPSPEQQGVGFGTSFTWDVPLREGYENEVLRARKPHDDFHSGRFWGIDAPGVAKAVEASAPDAVVVNGWHSVAQVRAILACRKRRIPLLYRGDTHLADRGKGLRDGLWRARTRWLLGRFSAYLSVGARARAYLRSFGVSETRIFHSPHAVDNRFFAEGAAPFQTVLGREEVRRELSLGVDANVVLFVGKIEPKKRLQDLIRAVKLMVRPVVVVVAGTGPCEISCREVAADLGVDTRWLGFSNQSKLARIFAASDCLVLPSGWGETWGLVVNEAMATGLPAVVSDRVGCALDLIEPGRTGEIFPMGDIRSLSSAIERVLDRRVRGTFDAAWCKERVGKYDFDAATRGLIDGCRSTARIPEARRQAERTSSYSRS